MGSCQCLVRVAEAEKDNSQRIPAIVSFLNPQPALSLSAGTALHAPQPTFEAAQTSDRVAWKCVIPDLPDPDVRMPSKRSFAARSQDTQRWAYFSAAAGRSEGGGDIIVDEGLPLL